MKRRLPAKSMLDSADLPIAGIARIAKREGMRPRPVYQAHKWFARRFATTARSLLAAAVSREGSDFWKAYYGDADCGGITVLDPFMGGGVMLLEAARLGASIRGVDVEPVAAIVADFQGRLWDMPDLTDALERLKGSVGRKLAPHYATFNDDGCPETMLHAFWVQTVDCVGCGHVFDAHPRFEVAVEADTRWIACRECSGVSTGRVSAKSSKCGCGKTTMTAQGHCRTGAAVCPRCGTNERLIDLAKRRGKPEFKLFAVETIPAGPERRFPNKERVIRSANDHDLAGFRTAQDALVKLLDVDTHCLASGPIPTVGRSDERLLRYGYSDYQDLFNARQKLHLATLAKEIMTLEDPVREAMAIAFSDHLTKNNMLCGYAGGWRRLSPLFSIRAFRHIARPVEINPWLEHNGRGTYPNAVRAVVNAAKSLNSSMEPNLAGLSQRVPPKRPKSWNVTRGDAKAMGHIGTDSVDLVLTDPPYFDYIAYSELGHFFVPWLVHFGLVDEVFLHGLPEGQLASPNRSKANSDTFSARLGAAFKEVARVCRPDGRIVFTYQNLDGKGWAALAHAMASAGVHPKVGFPLFGDGASGLHKHANSISWDCVLVCRKGDVVHLGDVLGRDEGASFAMDWGERLAPSDQRLSAGDLVNLTHAGNVIAAFARAEADRAAAARPLRQRVRRP